ncbi:D-isomer specific 2-hydroxyacid dehydrogenase [Dactylonectria macrodidyma]|uniref:D-isomer specific 2-hydroxyacid dehydrogenase n=1 Tax=Dactylonectria macrodidyma TaxID=307937 RepID=A0A9P9IKV2_9HYPO|nr:D-isomer specific 2-hydroxyacid dehydrogenase [Dactylonectria macrodidyma]
MGERVLRRLKPFDCEELLYYDYQPLSAEKEVEIGCRRVDTLELLAQCDIVIINCPLHEKTKGIFNKDPISKMKKSYQTGWIGWNSLMMMEDLVPPFYLDPGALRTIKVDHIHSTDFPIRPIRLTRALTLLTLPVVPSSRRMLPRPSSLTTSSATAVTSGPPSPRPETSPAHRQNPLRRRQCHGPSHVWQLS